MVVFVLELMKVCLLLIFFLKVVELSVIDLSSRFLVLGLSIFIIFWVFIFFLF